MLTEYTSRPQFSDLFREMQRRSSNADRLFLRLAQPMDFPPANIWSSGDSAIVTAELPGVSPDKLDITIQQVTVTLRGTREPEVIGEGIIVHRQERPHGDFVRAIVLPFRVDAEKVSAHFVRGILRLELPRPEQDKPRKIKVAGEGRSDQK
jgi:HSP20 family protein